MQLLLFRSMARGDINAAVLGKMYLPGSGQNINDTARAFINQYFRPMTKELIRHFRRVGEQGQRTAVPAADRVVRLDHNAAPYRDVVEALENLEKALQQANDYPDAEDKDQKIAEVSATRRLLQSIKVRVAAVIALIVPTVTYLATHFMGTAIDKVSTTVIEKLMVLFGPIF